MAIKMVKGYSPPPQEAGADYSGFAMYAFYGDHLYSTTGLMKSVPALNGYAGGCYSGNCGAMGSVLTQAPTGPTSKGGMTHITNAQASAVPTPDVFIDQLKNPPPKPEEEAPGFLKSPWFWLLAVGGLAYNYWADRQGEG